MPKTFVSPFPQSPKTVAALATAAVAVGGVNSVTTDTPAGVVKLLTAGSEGALVTRITAVSRTNIAATSLFLFLRRANDPADYRALIDGVSMAAQTMSASAFPTGALFPQYNEGTPLRLGPGDELYVGIGVAASAGVMFRAEYRDF